MFLSKKVYLFFIGRYIIQRCVKIGTFDFLILKLETQKLRSFFPTKLKNY